MSNPIEHLFIAKYAHICKYFESLQRSTRLCLSQCFMGVGRAKEIFWCVFRFDCGGIF